MVFALEYREAPMGGTQGMLSIFFIFNIVLTSWLSILWQRRWSCEGFKILQWKENSVRDFSLGWTTVRGVYEARSLVITWKKDLLTLVHAHPDHPRSMRTS